MFKHQVITGEKRLTKLFNTFNEVKYEIYNNSIKALNNAKFRKLENEYWLMTMSEQLTFIKTITIHYGEKMRDFWNWHVVLQLYDKPNNRETWRYIRRHFHHHKIYEKFGGWVQSGYEVNTAPEVDYDLIRSYHKKQKESLKQIKNIYRDEVDDLLSKKLCSDVSGVVLSFMIR